MSVFSLFRNLVSIHAEFIEIKKALEKAVVPAEKYRCEMIEANKRLQDHIWSEVDKYRKPSVSITSTSTSDLSSTLNDAIEKVDASTNTCSDASETDASQSNGRIANGIRQSAVDPEKTKLLIEDNVNLRIG